MKSPTRPLNRWSVWMRSRSRCTLTSGHRFPLDPAGLRNETTSTNDAALPTSSPPRSRKPDGISPYLPPHRSAPEFAKALDTIVSSYPSARTIHVVMDNLNIHGRKSRTDYFGDHRGVSVWNRLSGHDTPKHGSWLNPAEIETSLCSRQCRCRR